LAIDRRGYHHPRVTIKTATEARAETAEELRAFLAAELPVLRRYMGETPFAAMVRRYAAEGPPQQPRTRWRLRDLPDYLTRNLPFSRTPELAELAGIELAFAEACEAPESGACHKGPGIAIDPSHRILTVTTNAASLWSALRCGEIPPRPYRLEAPQDVLVWRQGETARFRLLGSEEAAAIADPCESRAGPYLPGWIEAGLVSHGRSRPVK
jgi:Putative DNA-binding domain